MKEYISMERAVAIVSALELRSEMRLHIDDLHAICNAAAEQARSDFLQELLGMDVGSVGAASYMPGTIGFTMVVFKADDVPVRANLLTTTQAAAMRLQEREACAKVCDEQAKEAECPERARYCADALRNR